MLVPRGSEAAELLGAAQRERGPAVGAARGTEGRVVPVYGQGPGKTPDPTPKPNPDPNANANSDLCEMLTASARSAAEGQSVSTSDAKPSQARRPPSVAPGTWLERG